MHRRRTISVVISMTTKFDDGTAQRWMVKLVRVGPDLVSTTFPNGAITGEHTHPLPTSTGIGSDSAHSDPSDISPTFQSGSGKKLSEPSPEMASEVVLEKKQASRRSKIGSKNIASVL